MENADRESNGVAVFETHDGAERAIRALHRAGFDMRRLSIIGRDFHSEEHAVGFYTAGGRVKHWGKLGAFWGGVLGFLLAPALFWIPGIGPIVTGGIIGSVLMGAIEGGVVGAAVGGGTGVLAAALASLGIPNDSIIRYESELKADKYLLIASGTTAEVERARSIITELAQQHRAAEVIGFPQDAGIHVVASSYEQIAQQTTPEVDMFRAVAPEPSVSGRELEDKVREALRADPRLAQMQIDVIANGSRVWLTGTTIGPGTAAYAEDVVRRVEGVSVVYNDLATSR